MTRVIEGENIKKIERDLLSRFKLGDQKAAFEFAHYLTTTHQYSRYKEILKHFRIAAKAGIPEAMLWLGFVYEDDWNPLKSKKKAYLWFLEAAKANNAEACNRMAVAFEGGIDLPKNLKIAIFWYKKGAALGDFLAQYNLGVNYEKGIGVRRNMKKAINWYKAASLQNHPDAKSKLRNLEKNMK